jgi:hypothetical protein
LNRFFIQTDNGLNWIKGPFVNLQDVFHARKILLVDLSDAPHFFPATASSRELSSKRVPSPLKGCCKYLVSQLPQLQVEWSNAHALQEEMSKSLRRTVAFAPRQEAALCLAVVDQRGLLQDLLCCIEHQRSRSYYVKCGALVQFRALGAFHQASIGFELY